MSDFGFVSSGNADEDTRIAQGIIRRNARVSEGICPNGCGPMEPYSENGEVWPDAATCPKCGFYGSGPSFNIPASSNW